MQTTSVREPEHPPVRLDLNRPEHTDGDEPRLGDDAGRSGPERCKGKVPSLSTTAVPSRTRLALLLGGLIALGPLTIDMYLPALPGIAGEFAASASTIQLTLTGTLVGLAAGQLFIGPLADAVGRRTPLLIGTTLHIVSSLLIMVAPNIAVFGALRVLQGVGGAAGAVVAMAVVRDLFTGRPAATLLSRLMLVMGAAPVLAPTLGGELLRFADWRGVFAFLALYGAAILALLAFALPETLPAERRRPARIGATLVSYGTLFKDRTFVGLILMAGFAMAGMFGYVSGSSFVFQEQFGLDAQQFGLLFGAGAIFLIGATQGNAALLRYFEPKQILLVASIAGTVSGAVLAALAATGVGGLVGVVAPLWAVLAAVGFMLPNAPALALSRHGERAGTAAALLGAVQFGVGALTSPVVGLLGNDALAMGLTIAGAQVLALAVLVVVVRPWTLADLEEPTPVPGKAAAEAVVEAA
ncbi:MFS transporter, DHA1 family, bicyclomycin/chloramphenicol resistance protein [Pseudonocardia oroxyli]|uniref:MFS transporter, DHA1 family, bicyclomycin/chloramphenicol resistance protein n=1 Tax=Pseudonocardia oroxyli TaxID=366584 RepID=A0A1G7PM13_PSEOR|nr:MFS transporter, DHA1 family, bicyclomycin/chloramphenicol resistance protein [Pseudonocardia oroxyli]